VLQTSVAKGAKILAAEIKRRRLKVFTAEFSTYLQKKGRKGGKIFSSGRILWLGIGNTVSGSVHRSQLLATSLYLLTSQYTDNEVLQKTSNSQKSFLLSNFDFI
jgi:hypothetical protein